MTWCLFRVRIRYPFRALTGMVTRRGKVIHRTCFVFASSSQGFQRIKGQASSASDSRDHSANGRQTYYLVIERTFPVRIHATFGAPTEHRNWVQPTLAYIADLLTGECRRQSVKWAGQTPRMLQCASPKRPTKSRNLGSDRSESQCESALRYRIAASRFLSAFSK